MENQKVFMKAIKEGDFKQVKTIFSRGVKINHKGCHPGYTKDGYMDSTPLHLACAEGHLEIAQFLLDNGADINSKQKGEYGYDNTPLFIAAQNGYSQLAKLLFDKGANIKAVNSYKMTILDTACESGLLWLVKELVNKGLPLNKPETKKTPLYYAVYNGHKAIMEYLIENGANLKKDIDFFLAACHGGILPVAEDFLQKEFSVKSADQDGQTPLHYAASGENTLEVARLLIKNKAKVNAKVKNGYDEDSTPLHFTAKSGNVEVAGLLLENEADINCKDKWNRTPLYKAAYELRFCPGDKKKKLLDLIMLLIQNDADIHTPMGTEIGLDYEKKSFVFWAVENNYPDIVAACIKKKADLTVQTIIGQNPLYFAAEKGFTEICTSLIQAGSDINYQGYQEKTPLMLSAENGHPETARLFIDNNADITLKDEQERTALHAAAAGGLDWLVKHLIQKGIDVNSPDKYGGIPLGAALFDRNYNTAKLLIESGSDVNKKGLSNNTPLHYACNAGGDAGTVLALLKKGADPNQKTDSYKKDTALHQAAGYGLTEIVKHLLDHGADMEIKDANGETALCRAVSNNHFDIVKVLVEKGARFSYHQKQGFSAIQYALDNDNSEIFEYLLDHIETGQKASKDIFEHIDEQLILAAKSDDWSKVHTWLRKEADVNYKDEKGKTALFYAVEHGNDFMVKLLLQNGADVNIKDNDGKKPIDFIQADKDNSIRNYLKNPIKLFEKVEKFTRHLKGRVTADEIKKAAEIIAGDESLFACVSEKELEKIKTIETKKMKDLAAGIEKARNAELYTYGTCSNCGRKTLKALDREVLHGNPSSPAADTEVVFHCKCLSCGINDNVYV